MSRWVGGTGTAFQILGAPWLDPDSVIRRLDRSALLGVDIEPTTFTPVAPTDFKYPGMALRGVPGCACAIVSTTTRQSRRRVARRHPCCPILRSSNSGLQSFDRLATGPDLRVALEAGRSVQEIWDFVAE